MKRCYSVEDVVEVYIEGVIRLVGNGIIGAEDGIRDVALFTKEYTKFHKENKIQHMMLFTEDHEKLDEEFGVAFVNNRWELVSMCGDATHISFGFV